MDGPTNRGIEAVRAETADGGGAADANLPTSTPAATPFDSEIPAIQDLTSFQEKP
jgi:hypothetical protein